MCRSTASQVCVFASCVSERLRLTRTQIENSPTNQRTDTYASAPCAVMTTATPTTPLNFIDQ